MNEIYLYNDNHMKGRGDLFRDSMNSTLAFGSPLCLALSSFSCIPLSLSLYTLYNITHISFLLEGSSDLTRRPTSYVDYLTIVASIIIVVS